MAKVQFFKPYDEIAGKKEMEIIHEHPISVQDLLKILAEKIPSFQTYLSREGGEVKNFFVLLVRGDQILKLKDMVSKKDLVKVLPPLSGG